MVLIGRDTAYRIATVIFLHSFVSGIYLRKGYSDAAAPRTSGSDSITEAWWRLNMVCIVAKMYDVSF